MEYRIDLWDKTALLKYEPRNELSHDMLVPDNTPVTTMPIPVPQPEVDPFDQQLPGPMNYPVYDSEMSDLLDSIGTQLEQDNSLTGYSCSQDLLLDESGNEMFVPVYNMFESDRVFQPDLF
jgi:hypothetical protein